MKIPRRPAAKDDAIVNNGNGNRRKPRKAVKKKKEKTDREEIFEALQKLGHEPFHIELDGRPQSLHALVITFMVRKCTGSTKAGVH